MTQEFAWGRKEEGDELFKKGDFEGAIESYSKALDCFHETPRSLEHKGLALSELKRYDEAIKSYDVALEHYPRETIVWIKQRCSSQQCGQKKQIEP